MWQVPAFTAGMIDEAVRLRAMQLLITRAQRNGPRGLRDNIGVPGRAWDRVAIIYHCNKLAGSYVAFKKAEERYCVPTVYVKHVRCLYVGMKEISLRITFTFSNIFSLNTADWV